MVAVLWGRRSYSIWRAMPDYVDTTGTVHACAGAAKKQGAEIVENNRVLALSQTANGWEVVTEKGAIPPEHVVNAASLRAKQVGRMAGSELPVLTLNHHYLISDTIPELEKLDYEVPMTVGLEGASYMRQDQRGFCTAFTRAIMLLRCNKRMTFV